MRVNTAERLGAVLGLGTGGALVMGVGLFAGAALAATGGLVVVLAVAFSVLD